MAASPHDEDVAGLHFLERAINDEVVAGLRMHGDGGADHSGVGSQRLDAGQHPLAAVAIRQQWARRVGKSGEGGGIQTGQRGANREHQYLLGELWGR